MYKRNCEIKSGIEFPSDMHRWALSVEYNGAHFNGFQKQLTSAHTIQAHLERALSKVANENIAIVCAGRTDAGVHASEQIIHFDTLAIRPEKAWIKGVNSELPDDIRVHWAKEVSPAFHARFSAFSRTYRYILYCAYTRPATIHKLVTWTSYDLSVDFMREASEAIVGEYDYTSFRASQCQAYSPVRCIEHIVFFNHGPFIVMEIRANAFLHHMVRNIAGTLIDIGRGAKPVSWMKELLDLRDRTKASPTARPWGLYLVKVNYDAQYRLPETPIGPIFIQK